MIAADQPTKFPEDVVVRVSSRADGTMLDRTKGARHAPLVVEHRRQFCGDAGISYDNCVYQIISYEAGRTYDTIHKVDTPDIEGCAADVLYTETPELGLFLPIADCVGTAIYDNKRHALALAHLGRHASIAKTLKKVIDYFKEQGSDAADLFIWMAPSVHQDQYKMEYFDHLSDKDWKDFALRREDGIYLDLQGFNRALAIACGVRPSRIAVSSVNTAANDHYFSHSQGDTNGRFAVVAYLR